jgi:hypothetical protein
MVQPSYHYDSFTFISCQCIAWNEKYVCKHSVALAVFFNFRLKGYSKEQSFTYLTKTRTKKAGKALFPDQASSKMSNLVNSFEKL